MSFATLITAFLFAFLPAFFWLVVYYRKDTKDPEPKRVIVQTFLMGALLALPFLALRKLFPLLPTDPFFFASIKGLFVFAAFEEIAKLSAAIIVVKRHKKSFNQILDGIIYAVTAALGFAFVENLFYFHTFFSFQLNLSEWISIVGFRSLGTMLAHTLFSGTAGLIWAYAVFSKKVSPFHKKGLLAFEWKDLFNLEILSLHIIRRNLLEAHPSRRGGHEKKILVLEGLVLATLLHGLFNFLATFKIGGENTTFILVPLIMGGFFYMSYLFTKRYYQKILKVV